MGREMNENNNFVDRILQGIPVKVEEKERLIIITPNMTAKEYAAIHLKVPRSGNEDIDGMIRESVRWDFAEKALRIIIDKDMNFPDALHHNWMEYAAEQSFVFADAMLAEWDKEVKVG
jgi:hypothetical protein